MKYEIWLSNSYTLFDRGIAHLNDGRQLSLLEYVHTATYGKDSVLIDDEEYYDYCRFPLRWFVEPDGLELYSWDDITSIIFHNESNKNIRIGKFGLLRPGENIEIFPYQEENDQNESQRAH